MCEMPARCERRLHGAGREGTFTLGTAAVSAGQRVKLRPLP